MPGINLHFLNLLKENYRDYPIFIETGTNEGGTTFSVEPHFNTIYTIELSQKYYTNTKSKYNGEKINFLLGDSSDIFKTILPTIHENAIFFLDGHWSSGDTAKGKKDCPLVEEIQSINNLYKHKAIIIVDDFRLFGKGPKSGMLNEDWTEINKQALLDLLCNRITDVYHLDSHIAKNDRIVIHISSCE
jgi:hypothetical protein